MDSFSSATWRDAVVAALGYHGAPRWSVAGEGPWTKSWSLHVGRERLFVKTARASAAEMFAAEADGLRALASTATIKVPSVRLRGTQGDCAFLVLSWLDLGDAHRGEALGRALATLHRIAAPSGPSGERYGWSRDNYIGGAPQLNGWTNDWATFFCDRRLKPQLARVLRAGYGNVLKADGELVLGLVPELLAGHEPLPSLLHGDLWSGNAATLIDGTPVMFDPAVYVGDREADLAMTRLFGGFDVAFYRAYEASWPLPPGHDVRRDLYNLYHVLNHLSLFGTGYLDHARTLMKRLLKAAS
ncbi:MAG TPA: fructosamine kinase family protein [Casimicrobiaceae bacterium]|nr:fructosamine kinase family protein [Casimicrobiaceae bacterium]